LGTYFILRVGESGLNLAPFLTNAVSVYIRGVPGVGSGEGEGSKIWLAGRAGRRIISDPLLERDGGG